MADEQGIQAPNPIAHAYVYPERLRYTYKSEVCAILRKRVKSHIWKSRFTEKPSLAQLEPLVILTGKCSYPALYNTHSGEVSGTMSSYLDRSRIVLLFGKYSAAHLQELKFDLALRRSMFG